MKKLLIVGLLLIFAVSTQALTTESPPGSETIIKAEKATLNFTIEQCIYQVMPGNLECYAYVSPEITVDFIFCDVSLSNPAMPFIKVRYISRE